MKILRLTTQNPQALFDTNINDELLLAPDAKIALQSLTLEQDDEFLVIDDTNDTFTYSTQTGQQTTITIPHQVISFQNFHTFFETFTKLLNNSINYEYSNPSNSLLGIEWFVDTDTTKKVVIENKKAAVNEHADMWITGTDVDRQNGDIWAIYGTPSVGDLDGYTFNMLSPKVASRGNGFLRCQVYKALFNGAGNPKQGVLIGFSKTNLGEITSAEFTENMVDYGLSLTITADGVGDYRAQEKANFTDTTYNLDYTSEGDGANDYMEIQRNGTTIKLVIYGKNNGLRQYDIATNVDSNIDLYPFIVFHQDHTYFKVNKVRTTISPFANDADFTAADKVDEAFDVSSFVGATAPPMPPPGRTAQFIDFNTEVFAEFLGYNNQRVPQAGTTLARNIQYIADKIFKPRFFVQTMLVEMLNLKLDSYDGLPTQEQRKSILAFIPQGNQDRITVYEPNNLNFINLKNREPILLRNIKARIIQGDYTNINLLGQASLVLLIDE